VVYRPTIEFVSDITQPMPVACEKVCAMYLQTFFIFLVLCAFEEVLEYLSRDSEGFIRFGFS
jgi:hypothetical protein